MEHNVLITILGVFIANAATVIPLFLWARTESRSDYRECRQLIDSIHTEIKDFHGRLCAIEERNKKGD